MTDFQIPSGLLAQIEANRKAREETERALAALKSVKETAVAAEPVAEPVKATPNIAYDQYKKYLQALFTPTDTVCFVFIQEDSKIGPGHDYVRGEEAFTEKCFVELQKANKTHSVYVAMNPYKSELLGKHAGRTKENVAEVKRLYADADKNGDAVLERIRESKVVPPPNVIVNTSPGKYQFIWNVPGLAQEIAEPLMKAIAQEFGTDPAVHDIARIFRVPGFKNRKKKYEPEAPEVTVVGDIDDCFYDRVDFQLQYKPTETAKEEAPRDSAGLIAHGFIHNYMLAQAGKLRNMGLDAEQIEPALLKLVHDNCAPPIDDSKVKAMAYSICNFPPGENTDLLLTQQAQTQNQQPNRVDVSNWLSMFRSVEEMEDGPIVMVIDGVLQEGTCFIGANPGDGKTLIGLAFAKSISTGTPLFGLPQYAVTEPRTVIYLIPESRDRAFRKRCEAFGMSKDKMKFMARTISAGVPLELGDPYLLEAVRQTKAVVFLDTASRFMKGSDENAAAQNRQLVNDVIALLAAGAICVVLIHHATKAAKAKQEKMTLENMLRGSSDLGAMCDQAYGIRKDMLLYANGAGPMEIDMVNLKDREQVGGLTTLRLAASHKNKGEDFPVSYINETGNFKPIDDAETHKRVLEALLALVESDRNIPAKELATKTGLTEYAVKHKLGSIGWHRVQGGSGGASPWHQDNGVPCPFAKEKAAKREKTSKPLKSGVTEVSVN